MIIGEKSMKNPDKINLDKNQADAFVARLESNSLTDFDRTILKWFWNGTFGYNRLFRNLKSASAA